MNYEDIFRERGGAYHAAMARWPDARREEFLRPLDWLAPRPGERVVDVPAGGGYLRHYLPAGCEWAGHEPCASFLKGPGALDRDLLPLPWADASADAAISIAGVHHLEDKRPLFRELRRVLRPGGRFVLADVHADSAVARFLDGFVGRYNSTGHEGDYLGEHTLAELRASDWEVARAGRLSYGWWFASREEVGEFCRLLFDVARADPAQVADAVEEHLGLTRRAGQVGLNWELYAVLARPA